jgi:hypothetical protein
MGDNVDVDTSAFRRAIWNYIHCMFGIRHDDYDYGEVNILLERSLKSYIKTVTCYPEQTTKKDYDSFMLEFKDSEKVCGTSYVWESVCQVDVFTKSLFRWIDRLFGPKHSSVYQWTNASCCWHHVTLGALERSSGHLIWGPRFDGWTCSSCDREDDSIWHSLWEHMFSPGLRFPPELH